MFTHGNCKNFSVKDDNKRDKYVKIGVTRRMTKNCCDSYWSEHLRTRTRKKGDYLYEKTVYKYRQRRDGVSLETVYNEDVSE